MEIILEMCYAGTGIGKAMMKKVAKVSIDQSGSRHRSVSRHLTPLNRQTDRQAGRQTDRQTDRQRQAGRQDVSVRYTFGIFGT